MRVLPDGEVEDDPAGVLLATCDSPALTTVQVPEPTVAPTFEQVVLPFQPTMTLGLKGRIL